jgi:hypothetical protein
MKVRAFRESDRDEVRDLFSRAGQGSPSASLWGHVASGADIHLDPYMGWSLRRGSAEDLREVPGRRTGAAAPAH